MQEILCNLSSGARVLDLGSRSGSFDATPYPVLAIRLDQKRPAAKVPHFVQADAARLPFRAGSFDAVISNHSLEHFEALDAVLEQARMVLKSGGALYVAVPDSTTVTDRLYRWLARGGGHVNAFSSLPDLAARIERHTGLRLSAARPLCTSLSFLNRWNNPGRRPKRLLLLGGGSETVLVLLTYLFRLMDRYCGTRLSLYGWALYFGDIAEKIDVQTWTNVCSRCGSGHPASGLLASRRVERKFFLARLYACPACGAKNLFTYDEHYLDLK